MDNIAGRVQNMILHIIFRTLDSSFHRETRMLTCLTFSYTTCSLIVITFRGLCELIWPFSQWFLPEPFLRSLIHTPWCCSLYLMTCNLFSMTEGERDSCKQTLITSSQKLRTDWSDARSKCLITTSP